MNYSGSREPDLLVQNQCVTSQMGIDKEKVTNSNKCSLKDCGKPSFILTLRIKNGLSLKFMCVKGDEQLLLAI